MDEVGLAERLVELRRSLDADGYALDAREEGGRIRATISVAREDACADCLVPAEILTGILGQMLGVRSEQIDVTYPGPN
jgi:hypothetical protein